MDEKEARVERITARIMRYVSLSELPPPDWCRDDLSPEEATREAVRDILKRNPELNDAEAFSYMACIEHVDPTLEEDVALRRMDEILRIARARVKNPSDQG